MIGWIIVALVFLFVAMPIAVYLWSYMAGKGFFSSFSKHFNKSKVNQNGKKENR